MAHPLRNRGFQALLITQFLEAFNDNAYKLVVMLLAAKLALNSAGSQSSLWFSSAPFLFTLPYLLFSTFAGYLADRFSKQKIMIFAKASEVVLMIFGYFALMHISLPALLAVVFLMGTHSAFFGPSKYGILPEILDEDELSRGNGLMQLFTYAAIILGMAAAGTLLKWAGGNPHQIAYCFIPLACIGFITSFFITAVPPSGSVRPMQWNILGEIIRNTREIRLNRTVFLSMMGLVYFGLLGGLFQLNIIHYATSLMELDELGSSILLVILSVGIGIGSVLAGRFSDQKIELGLVPLGAIGISYFSLEMGFLYVSYKSVAICLFLLGVSCGFYLVPLNALIQQASASDKRGQVQATTNFYNSCALLFASAIFYISRDHLHLNPAHIFILTSISTVIGTIYVCRLLPYPLVRLFFWMLSHTLYSIRIINRSAVPAQGGALLVPNHVATIDAVILVMCTPRPIRFLVNREIYHSRLWGPILRLSRAIPILHSDNPKEIIRALQKGREAILNGELVCIFPEGQLTRTGNLLKFNKGMEHIMKGVDAPIVPVHLDRIWGSIFSFERGKYYYKMPKILPYPITVSFGTPMPPTSTAFEVRSKVMELGAEAFQYRVADKVTLPEGFWREARRRPSQFCMADSSGKKLSYGLTLISAVALANKLRGRFDQEKSIGILIPPSVAGALTNLAVSIINKVPVNINYTASKEAVASIIKQCAMQYVITSKAFIDKTGMTVPCELIYIEDVIKQIGQKDKFKAALWSFIFPAGLSHRLIFGPKMYRQHDKLATIMFTSGSTGEPKGVMLTHANVVSNLEGLYQVFNIQEKDIMLGILPFFHSFGFTGTLWFPLITGIGVVYHVNPLDAKVIGKLVSEHKATVLMATPTFLNAYIRRCETDQLKSLRMVTVGAEKLKETLASEFFNKFGVQPMEGYGCTELSPVVSINLPDYPGGIGGIQKAFKPGTIGLPLPGIAVKIVDQNTWQPMGINQDGLLLVKGPNVMKGYLTQPEKTADVIKDGWYVTGDIAHMDDDGFITITDRLSRFSKIAGEMVPHIKIEEAILSTLKESEQICAVTSVPDDKRGERLVVLYTKDIDMAMLLAGLKKSGLPNLWIPDEASFYKIETLPLLGSGKLDLGAIKRKAIEVSTQNL